MCSRYCSDPRTIILCVIPANQDMTNSDGLQLARQLDPKGERTIGVITKIDIMDEGTNAKDMLLGKVIPLKLGYVGVKGRSQADVNKSMTVKEALEKERNWFATHKIYSSLPAGYTGTTGLITKLTTVMYKHIRRIMPSIVEEIDFKHRECEDQIKELGVPLPVEAREKKMLLWKLISKFCDKFKMSIEGTYNPQEKASKDFLAGAKIKLKFNDLYLKKMAPTFSASKRIKDAEILRAIRLHTGDSLPGFISCDAFLSLINPLLQSLEDPAQSALDEVHSIMEQVAIQYINETFARFPNFLTECTDGALEVIAEEKKKTKFLIDSILQTYIGYNYTKAPEFISATMPKDAKQHIDNEKKKEELEKKEAEKREKEKKEAEAKDGKDAKDSTAKKQAKEDDDEDSKMEKKEKEKAGAKSQKENEQILIKEMRTRIDAYFTCAATQLGDVIPKLIGWNLIVSTLVNPLFLNLTD